MLAEQDISAAREMLRTHHFCLITGAFVREELERLNDLVRLVFQTRDLERWVYQNVGVPAIPNPRMHKRDKSFIYFDDVLETAREINPLFTIFAEGFFAGARAIAEAVSPGTRTEILPQRTVTRRLEAGDEVYYSTWHRDLQNTSMQDFDGHCFNMWVPLSPGVGTALPSITFALGSHLKVDRESGRALRHRVSEEHDEVVAAYAEDELVTPELAVGDVVIFSDTLLHRTQRGTSFASDRYSFEFRFNAL